MRVKIESTPPLPSIKAWYSIHTASTVFEFKNSLCSDLQPFRNNHIRAEDIILVLEDFELLDSSQIDVVRDGDLLIVRRVAAVSSHKRKASHDETGPARKKTKHPSGSVSHVPKLTQVPKQPALSQQPKANGGILTKATTVYADESSLSDSESTSSSESNSESESDSSESDSTSSSDTDSESDESSSALSTAAVPAAITKAAVAPPSAKPAPATSKPKGVSEPPHVPPGLGKPATHSRNVRRRRKRMYERLTATVEPASVNDIPLGARTHALVPAQRESPAVPQPASDVSLTPAETPAPPVFMMSSLQNKNKRKGFKDALAFGVPAKIVFSNADEETETSAAQDALPFARVQDHEVADAARPMRLIPPSEKQERGVLPLNMFVTSVDVEEGMPTRRRQKKKQLEKTRQYEDVSMDDGYLPYDEPAEMLGADAGAAGPSTAATQPSFVSDRAGVEARWSSLVKVASPTQLTPGVTVAWKALGINPSTFTPEMLLNLGRAVSCGDRLVVELFQEHGAVEISFGGIVVDEDSGSAEDSFEWQDVLQGDWRIVA